MGGTAPSLPGIEPMGAARHPVVSAEGHEVEASSKGSCGAVGERGALRCTERGCGTAQGELLRKDEQRHGAQG